MMDRRVSGGKDLDLISPMRKRELGLDLFAFLATIFFIIVLGWQARDVIWGLWACSLCVGYAYIVTAIVSPVYHAKGAECLLRAGGGIFLLGFFTFHFGMFHFVHSIFLNVFFPLVVEEKGFPNIFTTLSVALKSYWPFVLTTFISRFSDFPFSGVDLKSKDTFMKPYANVIRMHILIFVFAGLHAANLSQLAIYPVLAFYFFPWGGFLKRRSRRLKTEEQSSQRMQATRNTRA